MAKMDKFKTPLDQLEEELKTDTQEKAEHIVLDTEVPEHLSVKNNTATPKHLSVRAVKEEMIKDLTEDKEDPTTTHRMNAKIRIDQYKTLRKFQYEYFSRTGNDASLNKIIQKVLDLGMPKLIKDLEREFPA